jgi:non-ribosomal peptide synthetase component F
MRILIKELGTLYEAYSKGQESPLEELAIQYADFSRWQRTWLDGEVLERQLAYWKEQLGAEPPVLELPADRPRPTVQGHHRSALNMRLPVELSDQIKKLSMQEGATLFMTLLAAFKVLLYRYTWQEQIVVGTPIANRNRAEIEGLIGFFVNTLPLKTDLSGYPSFRELLARVREVALGAYTHQDVPFEKLVEELHPERNLSHTPLFQNMFVLQNATVGRLKLPGLKTRNMPSGSGSAMFDLILMMTDTNDALTGTVLYDVDLFDASTVEQLLDHYCTILQEVTKNPEIRLTDIPILKDKERGFIRSDSILQESGEVGSFAF